MTTLLDAALAAHPRAWREKYGEVVRGTLMDVADARGGRVPVAETIPLALRGLWMRARGSVAFWGGLVVIAIQVGIAATNATFPSEDSSTSFLRQLDQGLLPALVVLSLVAGWAAARARIARIETASSRLRRLVADSWPLVAVTALGYSVSFVVMIVRFGTPWLAWSSWMVVASQILLVLTAIAIGEMLGAVLPRVLVIFAAPAAMGAFALYVLSGNAMGAASFRMYFGIAYEVDLVSFVRGVVLCAVIVAVAIGVVALRSLWLRALPVAALLVGAAVANASDGSEYNAPNPVPRAESELICSEVEPVVCLWPEQEAAFGPEYREQIDMAHATATALGLPVDGLDPRSVTRWAMTGISAQEGVSVDDLTELGFGYGMFVERDHVVNAYAFSMAVGSVDAATPEFYQLSHAIAVLLGVPADETWAVAVDQPTGQRFLDPADAPTKAESRALVERWLAEGLDGVRAPS